MTEDYKEQLLNYVTGNLEPTSPTTDEIFKEIIEANRNDWIGFMPNNWQDMHIEGIIKSNTGDVNIMYGGYYNYGDSPSNAKGFIIIIDNSFKPIKYIDKFSSGTQFRYIQCMKQAEDNSFYMIDDTYYAFSHYETEGYKNGTRRFVLLNNFSILINGNYEVNLRTSYIFSSNYNNFYCRDIFKDINTAHYVFLGKYYQDYANTKTISLKINVGQANEWEFINSVNYGYAGSYVTFDSNSNYYVKMICNQESALRNYFITATKGYNDNSYTYTNTGNFNYYIDIDTENFANQVVFINENEVYFVGNNQIRQIGPDPYDKYIGLYKYNYSTSTLKTIYEEFIETARSISKKALYICKNQNEIYLEYNTNINVPEYTADYYYQRLINDTWDLISLGNHKFMTFRRGIYTGNNFNLISTFLYPTNFANSLWYFSTIKEIYNPTQYNGEPYIGINVLNPKYSNLYSNGSLVFSRNLYNISKQNNMTMSSVEIPNNYLNDLTITQNDLISKTNLQMNSDTTNWTKNIYEVVDLNFLNTISVIDEDTSETYLQGAIRINNAITDINDYSNATCNKVRINYVDNTTKVFPIPWKEIDSLHKQTEFSIYVDKPIISIDFISNDTNTIYCTKELEVEVGKYYTINEKIKVGD